MLALDSRGCRGTDTQPDHDPATERQRRGHREQRPSGYLLKDIKGNGLVEAIRAVASGKNLLDPARVRRVRDSWSRQEAHDPKLGLLTPQERRILDHIAEGQTKGRSGRHWGWPRRQSRTTSPPSWPSWVWSAARGPRSMWRPGAIGTRSTSRLATYSLPAS